MYIISVVIENERAKVTLFDKQYKLLTKKYGDYNNVSALCNDIISEKGIKVSEVHYIGVAVDALTANPESVTNSLEKSLGIKCYCASLLGARALGEAYSSNDVPFLVMLKIDDTVECGIVIDKKLYSGANDFAARVAHMVINFDGYECACGRHGCFEAYASNSGLRCIAKESGMIKTNDLTHSELFLNNTPEAKHAQKLYVEYLASGITDIINLFQPNELVLDGPFTKVGDPIILPMMDIVLREQYTHDTPNQCNVRLASLDTDIISIGAALLGR